MSFDYFFGNRLKIKQPVQGYRAGIAPLFLAAAMDSLEGESILDVGAGVGVASCALGLRCPKSFITGLEIQKPLANLARENVIENQLRSRIKVVEGDLFLAPSDLVPHNYDHVMTNPPFYDLSKSRPSPDASKTISHHLNEAGLDEWVRSCSKYLKPKGTLTVIHRSSSLTDIIKIMQGPFGGIKIYPLWPHAQEPAKLVLLQGTKGSRSPSKIIPGMVLHDSDGNYTKAAKAVLYDAEPLLF